METICELVRRAEGDYTSGKTTISKYVDWSLYETIEKIYAYSNSKHISGQKDSLNRVKPFFNIGTAAVNVWYRATDIDRKNIRVKATKKSDYASAFIATLLLQEWMRKTSFGKFLNQWGRTLAQFGSAMTKFVEKDGELISEVIPWNRLIIDAVDCESNPIIEKLYFTPSQLRKKKEYNQEFVEALCESQQSRQLIGGQNQDQRAYYIEVYEIHGEFSEVLYKKAKGLKVKEGDEDIYSQQMHIVSFVSKKTPEGEQEYDEYTLYCGKESESPYILTHLIKEDGRSLSIGAIESLFEDQFILNHTSKLIKDQLDLASKLIFQTSDDTYVGRNVLSNIQSGDIMVHKMNQPLTQIQNNSHDITALLSYGQQFQSLGREKVSTPEAMTGSTMPSGTAYRQVLALQQEAHSLFELMTENKGLDLETMLRKKVLPNLKKKMDTSEEISAILESHQITQLDTLYVPNEAIRRTNRKILNKILSGDTEGLTPEWQAQDIESEKQSIQQGLASQGNQRFIKPSEISTKTWKDALKDLEWELEVEITNESVDKQAVYDTLNTVLQTIVSNPAVLQDPNAKMIFGKILEETGKLSPIELSNISQPVSPAVAGSVAGQQQTQPMIK